jgi:hypothetical protein
MCGTLGRTSLARAPQQVDNLTVTGLVGLKNRRVLNSSSVINKTPHRKGLCRLSFAEYIYGSRSVNRLQS